jgi:hypothetical protein
LWDPDGVSATASRLPAPAGQRIDEYLAGLSRRLAGPRRVKADLLAEARDGLVDAAEAYADAGRPPSEAVARALADFGEHRQVLADYQAELAAAQGRRTALLVTIVMPSLMLMSRLLWTGGPWAGSGPPSSKYLLVAYAFDTLQVTAAIMALLTLLGYGWGSRFLPAERVPAAVLLTRLMGAGVLFFVSVQFVTGAAIYVWSAPTWPTTVSLPATLAGAAMVSLALLGVARSGLRCLRTSGTGLVLRPGD